MNEELSRREKQELERWHEQCKRIRLATEGIVEETADERAKRIAKLVKPGNEEAFCNYYFPHYCSAPFGWFQRRVFIDTRADNSFNVWEWAREHAKSVFANVFIPALMLARGKLDGHILGSENQDKAKVLLADFEAELRENVKFKNDFADGNFNIAGSSLSQGNYYIRGGVGFWAFGLGQNPAGVRKGEKRPNLGTIDDADSKKRYKNQVILQQDLDWILGEFMGCLSLKGKTFIYANNRVSKKGLTAHMVGDVDEGDPKREGINHIKVFATEDPRTHAMLMPEAGGVPAWKERYTLEDLNTRFAEIGHRNKMRQYYHRHIEDGTIFKEEHFPWVDALPLTEYEAQVTYNDPSFKDTKKNDFKAIVHVARTGRYFDIIDCWIRQDTKSNMVKAHYDMHENIEAEAPGVVIKGENITARQVVCQHWMESNFIQDILLDEYATEGDLRGYQLRIRGDSEKKPDKFGRIEDLEPLAARGLIRFNAKNRHKPDMQTLRDQFLAFPSGHDDGPDAVEGAIKKLTKATRSAKFNPRMGKFNQDNKNRRA